MNLSEMVGHKQAPEGNGPRTDFMNLRKVQPSDRSNESHISHGAEYTRGIDHLIQGLVDLLPKRDGTWPHHERAKWLRLAAGIFDFGYKAGDGEHNEINIVVVKQEIASRPRATARDQTVTTN